MKMKMGRILVWAGVAMLLLAAPEAYARHGGKGMGGEHGEKGFGKIIQSLNLTAEQQKQIDDQRGEQRAKTKELREQLRTDKKALKEELDKPVSDQKTINSLVAEIKTGQGQLVDLRVNSILAIKGILSPEQFAQMTEQIKLRREIKKEMREEQRKCRRGQKSID